MEKHNFKQSSQWRKLTVIFTVTQSVVGILPRYRNIIPCLLCLLV